MSFYASRYILSHVDRKVHVLPGGSNQSICGRLLEDLKPLTYVPRSAETPKCERCYA